MKIQTLEIAETIVTLGLDELVAASKQFDKCWYSARYSDVSMLAMDPVEHFLSIGEMLDRSPGPTFDTKFYRDTYTIWHPSGNPLIDYLTAKEFNRRPTTRAALEQQMHDLDASTSDLWGPIGARKISYCIPVMNRLDDIMGTLAQNLQANLAHRNDVEFLVIEFGSSREVSEWISSEPKFQDALEDGFLRVISDTETLDVWHFGRAKNAFKKHIRGQIYSSADADNFVTAEETAWLLRIADMHSLGFIAHHFGGDFGDGTCGRISMPTPLYRAVGYHSQMLPRQWDDLGLIAATMKHFPAAKLILPANYRTIMDYNYSFREFVLSERLANKIVKLEYPRREPALNPSIANYLKHDRVLLQSELFNSALARSQLTSSIAHQEIYMNKACLAARPLIHHTDADKLVEMLFEPSEQLMPAAPGQLCLFVSARDEADLLPWFLDHYRALGVDRFYIVDDGSRVPVAELGLGQDVIAVRPRVGDFKTSKGLWLGALSKYAVPENAWMLTVDADELVGVPKPFQGFKDLLEHMDRERVDFVPGLLIEMLPKDPSRPIKVSDNPFKPFDSFFYQVDEPDDIYMTDRAVTWGFGDQINLSWCVDVRYYAYGTIDSLRKIPLLRRRTGWHLNEGFHSIHPQDASVGRQPTADMFDRDVILPVFHYKLARLWSEEAHKGMVAKLEHYDPLTRRRISHYFGAKDGLKKLSKLRAFLRPKQDALQATAFAAAKRLPTTPHTTRESKENQC